MVHQHFMLADNFTVLENVILGSEPTKPGGRIDFDDARQHIVEVGRDYGLAVDPDELVETLEVGERQRVEIIKVLFRGAKILILDEPTAVLVPQEVEELFPQHAGAQRRGPHDHLHRPQARRGARDRRHHHGASSGPHCGDRQARGRDGARPGRADGGCGAPEPGETRESTVTDRVVLDIRDLEVAGSEDRGVALEGSISRCTPGRSSALPAWKATVSSSWWKRSWGCALSLPERSRSNGLDITEWPVRRIREAGVGYIPEDRHRRGLLLDAPLWENNMLGRQTQPPFVKNGWLIDRPRRELTPRK
jgi:general nucleoside transport system ATP-binding protein